MRIEKMPLCEFIEFVSNKRVYCFGTGIQGVRVADFFDGWGIKNNLISFIDNNENKIGKTVSINTIEYPIISYDQACKVIKNDDLVLITSLYYEEIYAQICNNPISAKWDVLAFDEVSEAELEVSNYERVMRTSNIVVIPKIIHYIWLGDEMPGVMKENINNWKKMCPDYKFIEWNDKNYDVSKNKYMKEAYDNKQWSFVSDYMRLDILYNYGGIYLDTDIELIKKPDELLYQDCFACVDSSLVMNLGCGVGAKKQCEVIKELRDYYDNVSFINDDGTYDKTSCNTHSHRVLKRYGVTVNDKLQNVHGMNIYPMIFQGACQYTRTKRVTDKTYWIHYGNMSWMNTKYEGICYE